MREEKKGERRGEGNQSRPVNLKKEKRESNHNGLRGNSLKGRIH